MNSGIFEKIIENAREGATTRCETYMGAAAFAVPVGAALSGTSGAQYENLKDQRPSLGRSHISSNARRPVLW